MKAVGIKVLKDKLSAYLKLVRQGEIVLVTDRDQVIAEIRKPMRSDLSETNSIDSILSEMENRGSVERAQNQSSISKVMELPPSYGEVDLAELLDEIRGDRH